MMEGFTYQADKALLDTVFDGVVVVDLKRRRISLANKAAADILGFSDPDELVGVEPLRHVSAEDRERATTVLDGLASGGCLQSGVEMRLLDKRGNDVWITARAVKLASNGSSLILASFRDITSQKMAEIALREAEQRQLQLLNSSGELILISQDWKIVFANQRLQQATGLSERDLVGRSILDLTHPDDREAVELHYRQILDGKYLSSDRPFKGIGKDGKTSWGIMRHVPVTWQGRPALMTIIQDITQQRLAEQALRESEERYRMLAENASDVIWTMDMNLNYTYNSPSKLRQSGYTPEEFCRLNAAQVLTPESLEHAAKVIEEELAVEQLPEKDLNRTRTLELAEYRKDGSILWTEATASFLRDKDGKPIGYIGISRDITERKRAEEALRASEERSRTIVENAAEGIIVVQDGWLKFANPKCSEVSGYSNEELLSRPFLDIVHPDDRQMIAENHVKRMAGEEAPNNYRFRIIDKTGGIKWLQINTVRFTWEGRSAVLSMLNDVTAQKEAEDALQRSERLYRLIAENSSDLIWTMDMSLRPTYVSPSVEKLTGFSVEEAMHMKLEDILAPESLEVAYQSFLRGLSDMQSNGHSPTSPVVVELELKRKDGGTVWTEVQMSFVQDSTREVFGIMGVARNIDERRRARKALEESEGRFRALIEGALDAIAVIDAEGNVKYSSPSVERMSTGSLQGMVGRDFLNRIHPDDLQRAISAFGSLVKSPDGTVTDIELRYRRLDGSWGVFEARGTNRLHDPKLGGIVFNYRDITDRRQAQQAFQESESRYRILAESVSDVIWSLDIRTKAVFFSPSVTRLLGYTVDEARSLRMKEVVSPASYKKARTAFLKLSEANGSGSRSSSTRLEVELLRKDGSLVWVDMSLTLLRDPNGQLTELFGVMRDITQRKKVEEDLRSSEQYFRALIENAWDAIAIVSAEGVMLYESPSSARILGYEPEEIVGKNLVDYVRPEDVAAIADTFRRFRTEPNAIVMVDAGFRHKDGHYVECEGTLQNFLHDAKINGIVANYRDVTDRRRAEEAVRSSEERFRNLVEAASDWVWEVDANGVYTYASPNVQEVLGYSVGEVIGRSISDFMPAREASRFSKMFRAHAAKKEPFAFVESSRLHKDGRIIVMETSGVPFLGGDGGLLGYRGIGRDITDRKKVEKELENSLRKVEKTVEAAIQAISHTMETRDPYTTGHQRRVTQLACAIAKEMGMAPWQIDGIRVAGLLHDIGKIAVPTEILSKPGRLSDIEFSMIKAHPKVGFDILKNVEFEWPIARIVVQHHERLDGSGYPFGLRGRDILQESRILAVADVVEAMSSHRPYRPALGIDKALAELVRGEGVLYDPEVVRACSRVIKERGFKFEG
ncbi:MAG: PAS domain S-box protein [Dehalococcoidia bacterium]|nr:PAS domain S-box protein [Dehalococcoidia bacterium]